MSEGCPDCKIKLKLKFDDGSEFGLMAMWVEATKLKYGFKNNEQIKKHHIDHIDTCWSNKKYHDKYGEWDWEKRLFNSKSELAGKCIYADLRACIMGLVFKKMGSKTKVVALHEDGTASVYPPKENVVKKK